MLEEDSKRSESAEVPDETGKQQVMMKFVQTGKLKVPLLLMLRGANMHLITEASPQVLKPIMWYWAVGATYLSTHSM